MLKLSLKLRFLIVIVIQALLFSTASLAEENEMVFILKGRGNVFWKVINDGIRETADAMKVKAVLYNTDDDQSPEAQLNICLAALARKPKIIVMGAATKTIGIECYKKAVAAGSLIADIDGNVSVDDAKKAGLSLAFTVGSDNYLIGQSAAKQIAKTAKKDNPKILILKGLPGSIVSENRANGVLDGLRNALPKAQIVGSLTTDWDRMKAMNITLDILSREPELDTIFSASDIMTMGVIEAVRIAKKDKQVSVVSVDGIKDARAAITSGRMEASVAQLPYFMGRRAVELSLEALAGKVKEQTVYINTPVLTKEVLEEGKEVDLQYLR